MIPVDVFRDQKVAVFGMGRTGLSAARALQAGGADVTVWDDSEAGRAAALKQSLTLGDLLELQASDFQALVLSPGVPLTHPEPHPVVSWARDGGIEVIGDIELFIRALGPQGRRQARVIAITGTNGKSTTTALIGHILQRSGLDARVCGNIGIPVLDMDPPGDQSIYVLELSSFQIDLVRSLKADVAVLINISADHLDRHGTLAEYVGVKARIFQNQAAGDSAVIGIDDPYSKTVYEAMARREAVSTVPVRIGTPVAGGVFVEDGLLYDATHGEAETIVGLSEMPALPGRHNWQNAAIAYAAVKRFIPNPEDIRAGMKSFPGLAHRMEHVGTIESVRFINDSKATNGDAAAKALACFERVYWIAGGRAKEGGISGLDEYFPKIQKAYLIGEAAEAFSQTLSGKADNEVCRTLERAAEAAARDAVEAGEPAAVVFSPACASFDQFANFEARGDTFRTIVRGIERRHMKARARQRAGSESE